MLGVEYNIILIILFVIFVFFPTMSYWINQWSF